MMEKLLKENKFNPLTTGLKYAIPFHFGDSENGDIIQFDLRGIVKYEPFLGMLFCFIVGAFANWHSKYPGQLNCIAFQGYGASLPTFREFNMV